MNKKELIDKAKKYAKQELKEWGFKCIKISVVKTETTFEKHDIAAQMIDRNNWGIKRVNDFVKELGKSVVVLNCDYLEGIDDCTNVMIIDLKQEKYDWIDNQEEDNDYVWIAFYNENNFEVFLYEKDCDEYIKETKKFSGIILNKKRSIVN